MKFICQQQALSQAINMVSKAVSGKTTLPILSGIFFEAKDGQLKLIGNDLNLSIETYIEAEVVEAGNTVIPARLFTELIKKLPDSDVTFDINDANVATISCEDSDFKIVGLPGNEYPELPIIEEEKTIAIDKTLFCNMIRQTSFAISQDESRPVLTGALLEMNDGKLSMVAIDGFRMAIKNATIKSNLSSKAVVPGRTLNEINKLFSGSDAKGDLKISFDDKQALFSTNQLRIYSRLLAGEFINYNQILPSEHKSTVRVDTDKLLTSIDRSFLMARENKNVAIKLDIKDDYLTISSNSEMGSSMEKIHIKLEGHDLEIGFNPKYLMDALKIIDSEEVYLEFNNNVSPCIVKPVDNDYYTYLVLPCRISK
jgi:DNA polymerase-3 subunit beta